MHGFKLITHISDITRVTNPLGCSSNTGRIHGIVKVNSTQGKVVNEGKERGKRKVVSGSNKNYCSNAVTQSVAATSLLAPLIALYCHTTTLGHPHHTGTKIC